MIHISIVDAFFATQIVLNRHSEGKCEMSYLDLRKGVNLRKCLDEIQHGLLLYQCASALLVLVSSGSSRYF
jgi:hypothetical protein